MWVPGLDHAGIATQSVVEKSLLTSSGATRHDLGRDAFVDKVPLLFLSLSAYCAVSCECYKGWLQVWEWRGLYGGRINDQLRRVGASLDWSREAFTMDPQRSNAVQEAFMQLHDRGLVYRGNRLVNWCPHLQTAISDIEVDTLQVRNRFEAMVLYCNSIIYVCYSYAA